MFGLQASVLLAALSARDLATGSHSIRVSRNSVRLGRELGLAPDEVRTLELGSLLHDVGKLSTDQTILEKPGKLTEAEFERMREHPTQGATLLREISLPPSIVAIAEQHHERWDGKGYPFGKAGTEISLSARICAVADSYDAMVSDRFYRPRLNHNQAMAELLSCRGTQFDPSIINAFAGIPPEQLILQETSCHLHPYPNALPI